MPRGCCSTRVPYLAYVYRGRAGTASRSITTPPPPTRESLVAGTLHMTPGCHNSFRLSTTSVCPSFQSDVPLSSFWPPRCDSAYLSTLALPPLIPTAIPPSSFSTFFPPIEPPSLLPPMAANGHLPLSNGHLSVGFEYPDVTLLGCLLLWSPDSQMVVQDLEAGKVQVGHNEQFPAYAMPL